MMIVDTPGFQNPEQGGSARGASFEELCHNYAQDRLQRLFHERTFVQELERYKEVALDLASALPTPWPLPPSLSFLAPTGRTSVEREDPTFPVGGSLPCFCSLSFLSPCASRSSSLVLPQTTSSLCREFAVQEAADAFGAPESPSLPALKAPTRPRELPPRSSCLHVGRARPSLVPWLLIC